MPSPLATVSYVNLGCAKNQVDLERMLALLEEAGYRVTADPREAQLLIINSCGFLESAVSESIDAVLEAQDYRAGGLRAVLLTGCMAERYRGELRENLPELDGALGVGGWDHIVEAAGAVLAGEKYTYFPRKDACPMGGARHLLSPAYSAYLKIAEGCNNACSYCAIPAIRGAYRSRPLDELLSEARALERTGARELILVAQDISRYGEDLGDRPRLPDLLRGILAQTGIPWIRLLYCYPERVSDELISVMAENPRILPYIDLPIQHISDRVLSKMRRRGGSAAIRSAIARLRAAIPNIAIRSTAICGFPGESESEHRELLDFLFEARFARFGVFPYSREEGTPAAALPGQIPEEEKVRRAGELMEAQREISRASLATRVGSTETVLLEGYREEEGVFVARTAADAPQVDGCLTLPGDCLPRGTAPGTLLSVRVTASSDYDLEGLPAGESPAAPPSP